MYKEYKEYDDKGRWVYSKHSDGYEEWREYDDIAKLYKLFPDKYKREIEKLFYYNYVTKRGNLKYTGDACSINIDTEGSRHSSGLDSFNDSLDSIEIRITIKLKL